MVKVNGIDLPVDVEEELREFEWITPRWDAHKLTAASPFRYDKTPSFFVNLETGGWKDSGAYDEDYEKGNLVKLLAFLRSETEEETEEYLRYKYGIFSQGDTFNVNVPELRKQKKRIVLPESELTTYTKRHSYLSKRGIDPKIEALFKTRYSEEQKAVIIPWRHPNGELANLKYRKIYGKMFWYQKGGHPIRDLVFGLDLIHRYNLTEVFVCEAEIDALSVWSQGKPAIALGSASLNPKQVQALHRSPIKRLIIATDSDKAGEKVAEQIKRGFSDKELYRLILPSGRKDVNEALVNGELDLEKQAEITPPAFRIQNLRV